MTEAPQRSILDRRQVLADISPWHGLEEVRHTVLQAVAQHSPLGLRWQRKRWRGNYQIHYIGTMDERVPDGSQTRTIEAWMVHDLQLSYKLDALEGLRLTLGLDNVFDREAPLAASAFNDNIDGRSHELRGRYWYTKLSQRF